MSMDTFYQHPYVQNPIKFETYQPQILLKSRTPPTQDYSVPLHVDCSVEYELPDCAKPPQGVKIEPLLMIHPCHFRNLERQRRRPFENNMPQNSLLSLQHQPKQTRNTNSNNNNIINSSNSNNPTIQKQQINLSRNANTNNFVYNCDFTSHVADYQNNNNNNPSTNASNSVNNVQRYRNSNIIRNHPYAMPCAPRYPDIHYSTSHLPTLIYNV